MYAFTEPQKNTFYSSFSSFHALSATCPQIWPKVNGLASREQKFKNSHFYEKCILISFDWKKARQSFCQHCVSLDKTRRISNNLTLEGHFGTFTWVKVMTWPEKSMCILGDAYCQPQHTNLTCFHRFSMSTPKVTAEKLLVTFHDLRWPQRHKEGSPIAIYRFRVSSLPETRCLRVLGIVSIQNRRLSFFSIDL